MYVRTSVLAGVVIYLRLSI